MIDMHSKAAVLTEYKKPLQIRQYPIPEVGPGEILVRIAMAGICGTDVHLWDGELNIPLPVILGHETVGHVEQLGEGLHRDWRGNDISLGDRITWASSIACGECYYCRIKRQPTRCLVRKAYGISYSADHAPHLRGGYAEYILLRAGTSVFQLPDSVPTESVVGAGCALTTVLHGVEHIAVELGDVVIVQGAGPVGLAAVAVAIQSGASKVVMIGAPAQRLELAREFGAQAAISIVDVPDIAARKELVLKETGPFGADVVLECVGRPEAVVEGWELCRDGGRCLVLGQYANSGKVTFSPHLITRKQLQISGSWGFEPRHTDLAIRFLENPHWQKLFAREVTHRFSLDEANPALEMARSQTAGKVVITPQS